MLDGLAVGVQLAMGLAVDPLFDVGRLDHELVVYFFYQCKPLGPLLGPLLGPPHDNMSIPMSLATLAKVEGRVGLGGPGDGEVAPSRGVGLAPSRPALFFGHVRFCAGGWGSSS